MRRVSHASRVAFVDVYFPVVRLLVKQIRDSLWVARCEDAGQSVAVWYGCLSRCRGRGGGKYRATMMRNRPLAQACRRLLTMNITPIHLALLHSLTHSPPTLQQSRAFTICRPVEAVPNAAHHQHLDCLRATSPFCAPATRQLLYSLAQPNIPSQHGRQTLTCRHESSGRGGACGSFG